MSNDGKTESDSENPTTLFDYPIVTNPNTKVPEPGSIKLGTPRFNPAVLLSRGRRNGKTLLIRAEELCLALREGTISLEDAEKEFNDLRVSVGLPPMEVHDESQEP